MGSILKMGSLNLLPVICELLNPAPNSIPFTAGIENMQDEISLSRLSNNGPPSPRGSPLAKTSSVPPTESSSLLAFAASEIIISLIGDKCGFSRDIGVFFSLPTDSICPPISMPFDFNISIATAPAKHRATVILPEKGPPPLKFTSLPYFIFAGRSQ